MSAGRPAWCVLGSATVPQKVTPRCMPAPSVVSLMQFKPLHDRVLVHRIETDDDGGPPVQREFHTNLPLSSPFAEIVQTDKPLLIIAEDVEGEALGAALIRNPRIFLLDEPDSAQVEVEISQSEFQIPENAGIDFLFDPTEISEQTAEEGGRHTPFFTNYRPQFYFQSIDGDKVLDVLEFAPGPPSGEDIFI